MCSSVKQASLCLLLLFALGSMPCMFTNTIDEVGSFEDCRGLVVFGVVVGLYGGLVVAEQFGGLVVVGLTFVLFLLLLFRGLLVVMISGFALKKICRQCLVYFGFAEHALVELQAGVGCGLDVVVDDVAVVAEVVVVHLGVADVVVGEMVVVVDARERYLIDQGGEQLVMAGFEHGSLLRGESLSSAHLPFCI